MFALCKGRADDVLDHFPVNHDPKLIHVVRRDSRYHKKSGYERAQDRAKSQRPKQSATQKKECRCELHPAGKISIEHIRP